MKLIGLLGGMSWESTLEYYRILNNEVKKRLGGLNSARCLLYSVNFAEIETFQTRGEWETAGLVLSDAACALERGGADCIVLCTNTMHKTADAIETAVHIPFLHIADATAEEIRRQGLRKIGLLGTAFTMEEAFYKERLEKHFNLEVIVPEVQERQLIHRVIYDELVLGDINQASRQKYLEIIQNLKDRGAEGVILGCTEIGLLVKQADTLLPLFDTTLLHAISAVDFALS